MPKEAPKTRLSVYFEKAKREQQHNGYHSRYDQRHDTAKRCLLHAGLEQGFFLTLGFDWLAYIAAVTAALILAYALATDRSSEPVAAEAT